MAEKHDIGSLLARTATSATWVMAWRMTSRALGLISTLILVRLLAPSDFGLVALAASFAGTIDAFTVIGTDDALVRERESRRDLLETGFTINVIRGLGSGVVIAVFAWPIARFFHEPRLFAILIALAIGSVLDGMANVGTIEFRRDFAFHREFQLWIVPRVVSFVLVIALAWMFRSYWALVAGAMTNRILRVLVGYRIHPFRPRLSLAAWRDLVGYSTWSWVLAVVSMLRDQVSSFVIGRVSTTLLVGMFSVGTELAMLPVSEIVLPLGRAAFSGFAAARNQGISAAATYRRIVAAAFVLVLPAGVGIAALADPVVRLALGTQWLGAKPVVVLVGCSACCLALGSAASNLLRAYGHLQSIVAVSLAALVVRGGLLWLLLPGHGLTGAAIALAISIVIENLLLVIKVVRQFKLSVMELFGDLWRCAVATAVMAFALAWLGLGWVPVPLAGGALIGQIALSALAGAVIFTVVLGALWAACGRVEGGERDIFNLVEHATGRALLWLR